MAIGRISGQMLKANLQRSGVDLAFETNLLVLDVTNSFVGIGTSTPSRQLHISGTGAIRLPSGTSDQRGTAANGDIRYNSELNIIEGYSNGAWDDLTEGGIDDIVEDTSPQLGGNLDINGFNITSARSNEDINIIPSGTGSVAITKVDINGGAIDGATIGANSAAAGTFTSLDVTDGDITNVGDINVDSVSSDAGSFDLLLDDNTAAALEIKEGGNAYMTFVTTNSSEQITVDKKLVVSNGITFESNTVDINGGAIDGTTIGANSASPGTFSNISTSGTVSITGTSTGSMDNVAIGVSTAATGKFTTIESSGNVTVGGNLTVNGSTTTIESSTLTIEDPLIILAKNNSGGAGNTYDQGLLFNRGSLSNVAFIWDESDDLFAFINAQAETGATAGNITIDSYSNIKAGAATFTGNVSTTGTGTFNGGLTVGGAITINGDGSTAASIDGVVIGAVTAANGTFTTLTVSTALNTGTLKAADGTAAATIANSTGVITVGSSVLTTTDINGGTIDGTAIGGASAAAGAFTTLSASTSATLSPSGAVTINPTTAGTINNMSIGATTRAAGSFTTVDANDHITISADSKELRIGAGTDLTITHDGTNTTIDNNTGILKILGAASSSIQINSDAANVDTQISGDTVASLFYVDASADKIGIGTSTPDYVLDAGSTTGAIRVPNGNTAARPTAATGVIRYNTTTGFYEGSQDGSTWAQFTMGSGALVAINKVTTTGDGSTSTFSGFLSEAPASANNVMVFIDNVYQEPTENYTVSSNNITFTSAPHSGARIFAIEGFDNTAVQTGGVARSLTEAVTFESAATTIMSFNATSYRSAELYVQVTDAANTEYSCMKAHVIHDGTTAYINTYGVVNTSGSDTATLTATYSAGTVDVQAISTGGSSSAIVQYSLATV